MFRNSNQIFSTPKYDVFEIIKKDRNVLKSKHKHFRIVYTYSGIEFEEINNVNSELKNQEENKAFLHKVITFIQNNMSNTTLDLERLAMLMDVSKSTLCRKTIQFVGLSPCELIHCLMLINAMRLLLNDSLNISEVAYKVGFNDPKYFSRIIKKRLGLTPTEFRESIKTDITFFKNQDSDRLFFENAKDRIEKRISDSTYASNQFAYDMNTSRVTLYRKVKCATGFSPCKFIRHVRLKYAKELLSEGKYNLSEIALAVGFNDVKYFGRCFKLEFGMTPTQYQCLSIDDSSLSGYC